MAMKMDDIKHTLGDIKDSVAGTFNKGVTGALDAAHLQKKTPFGGKFLFLAAGIGIGATIGAGLALLLTPTTGKELRLAVKHYATKLMTSKPKAAAKLAKAPKETEVGHSNSHSRRLHAPAGEVAPQPT